MPPTSIQQQRCSELKQPIVALLLTATLITTGCVRQTGAPPPPPPPVPATAPATPGPAAPDPAPSPARQPTPADLVQGAGPGWLITPEGVWRHDPRGPALLRYLPPLVGSAAWKQVSGDAEVWFSFQRSYTCDYHPCWQLTVLNRLERTTYTMAPGHGILKAETQLLPGATPAPPAPPDTPRLPAGPLPQVQNITVDEFAMYDRLTTARAEGRLTPVDLNGDGAQELLEGTLGQWHQQPLRLFLADGRERHSAFRTDFEEPYRDMEHRLEVLTVSGQKPVLLYSRRRPGSWPWIDPMWLEGTELLTACGWHPKCSSIFAGEVRMEADGTFTTVSPADALHGFRLTRRYKVEHTTEASFPIRAALLSEDLTPGPYPTTPAALMTVVFLTHWFGTADTLSQYIPDPAVRQVLAAAEGLNRPQYYVDPAQVGRLGWTDLISPFNVRFPKIEPAAPDQSGAVDFLICSSAWDACEYVAGKVTFAPAADGRLTVQKLVFEHRGWMH